jgi:MFS family permease
MPSSRQSERAPPNISPNERRASVAAVIAIAATFGLTYGLGAPLIALDLARYGASEVLIGVNAAMQAVGVLAIAPLLPRLAVKFGVRSLMVAALVTSAAVFMLLPWVTSVAWWFPLRIALGAAGEVLFVLSETWTNELAAAESRGRTMAVYTAALSLGFAGGPAIIAWVGASTVAYVIGAAVALAAALPLASPWLVNPPAMHAAQTKFRHYLTLAPVAVATTVLNAGVETAGLSFLGLYATARGFGEAQAMQLVSTLMVGAILLQVPIGWLADKMNPRRLVFVLAVLCAFGALIWPWMFGSPALAYVIVFVWGGLFVGIYTVMLALVGSRFTGTDLVGVYSLMGLAWGIGALVGPSSVGVAMQLSPKLGLPGAIAFACVAFAVFLALARGKA